jgi:hypothetical protein
VDLERERCLEGERKRENEAEAVGQERDGEKRSARLLRTRRVGPENVHGR